MIKKSFPAAKVVHLTSVHAPFDNRILHKECESLASNGYAVTLIAPHSTDTAINGVEVKCIRRRHSRVARCILSSLTLFIKALKERADIYHFHDPELLPVGLLLRLTGNYVIYDIHEDYVTAIRQKDYLPHFLRAILSTAFGVLERLASRAFVLIIAERYYKQRFREAVEVLNYPKIEETDTSARLRDKTRFLDLLYTGNITSDRGALIHANIVNHIETARVFFIGKCDSYVADKIYEIAGEHRNRIHIEGVGRYVPYSEIKNYYESRDWVAGLAVFPDTPHYRQKELTKFFEYMMYGLPILCSNFPTWKNLVESNQVGCSVDPHDGSGIVAIVKRMAEDTKKREKWQENGPKAVREHYNWESESKKLLYLYQGIIQ